MVLRACSLREEMVPLISGLFAIVPENQYPNGVFIGISMKKKSG